MALADLGTPTYAGSAQTTIVEIDGVPLASPDFLEIIAARVTTGGAAKETKTSGTLGVTLALPLTELSVTGTVAFTLPDGIVLGQVKEIECTVAATTPLGTLTITTPFGSEPSTHVFTAVGQKLKLIWKATGWHIVGKTRAGTQVVVVGTTVLTGYDMALLYDCQVTATVVSSTTKGIPDSQVPGERCYIGCSVAASTPVGSITGVYSTLAGVAATDLQAIGATTDTVTLEWTGAKHLIVANSGITVA